MTSDRGPRGRGTEDKGTEGKSDQRCLAGSPGMRGWKESEESLRAWPRLKDRQLGQDPPRCLTLDYRPLEALGEPTRTL